MTPENNPKPAEGNAQAATSAQPASSGASRRANRTRRRWVWGVGAVVVLAVLAVGAWKMYPTFKGMRGRQYASEAQSLLRRGQTKEAGQRVKSALQLAPKDTTVLRAAANYCSAVGDPAGINYYQMLLATPSGSLADRTNLIVLGHATLRLGPAREQLKIMLEAQSNSPTALRLLVENHLLAKDVERAIKTAAYALKDNPNDTWFQLTLGSLLVDDPRGVKYRNEGRRLLLGLAVGSSPEKYPAENRLAVSGDLSKSEMLLLQKQISSRTNLTLTDEVLIYDLRRRLNPEKTDAIAREAIQRAVKQGSPTNMVAVSAWAAQHRQYQVVADTLPLSATRASRELAAIRAGVLAELKNWPELEAVLSDPQSPLGPIMTPVFRARIALGQGRKAEAEAQFGTLLKLKEIAVGDAQFIALQAEAAGLPVIAIDVYQRLASNPQTAIDSAAQCLRLSRQIDDIEQLQTVMRRLASIFPNDTPLVTEAAWLDLVRNQNVAQAWAALSKIYQAEPSKTVPRYALAFAELRMGRPQDALNLIQRAAVDDEALTPRMQLIHAVVLGANQQREQARKVARKVELSRLRPLERELIKDWL